MWHPKIARKFRKGCEITRDFECDDDSKSILYWWSYSYLNFVTQGYRTEQMFSAFLLLGKKMLQIWPLEKVNNKYGWNQDPSSADRNYVWQHNSSKHNDIIGEGETGGDAGRMRWFDGQGRGRAILPRAAASVGLSCAPSFWKQLPKGINAQFKPRVVSNPKESRQKGNILLI